MVSLCGLALSSLFVINNKSVVHADTVNDNNQNSAISWDNDSDQAQGVQNATQTVQNNAETSNVESSSVQRRAAVLNKSVQTPGVANVNDSEASTPVVINNPEDDVVNVHYVDRNGNSINDKNVINKTIGVLKTGQGSYDVPNGYQLNNPTGKYNITTHPYDGPNNVKVTGGSINFHVAPKPVKWPYDNVENPRYHMDLYNKIHIKFVDQNTGKAVDGGYDIDLTKAMSGSYILPKGYATTNDSYSVQKHDEAMGCDHNHGYLMSLQNALPKNTYDALQTGLLNIYEKAEQLNPGGSTEPILNVMYAGTFNHSTGFSEDGAYQGAYGGSYDGAKLPDMNWLKSAPDNEIVVKIFTKSNSEVLSTFYQLPTSIRFDSNLGNVLHKYGDTVISDDPDPKNNAYMQFKVEIVSAFSDSKNNVSGDTVTVPVHRINSYEFADNSGNVKSVNGNTVNVVLTKPQSVDPDSNTFCHSQATRTIQINFPDGQIPDSYKDIVDSHGNLKQTVHFTRPATEDALTVNILWYGNWTSDNQDHNFIGFEARTLPRIPGYTLSIKPA